MSRSQIIRAWKDQEYRRSLSNAERALLPAHPAGTIEDLSDVELRAVVGGQLPHTGSRCSPTNPSGCHGNIY
jgi:mersacidin/lichenicidin family type 2 lantibiotic